MIYYNQSPPWGQFNRFINDRCLEEIAEYVQAEVKEHILSWDLKRITEETAADAVLGAIRLDHTRKFLSYTVVLPASGRSTI